MTDPLTSLVERLEKATERSKALNREIARQVGWHRVEPRHGGGMRGGWIAPEDFNGVMSNGSPILDSLHGTTISREAPDFTGSIDAALTLVPEGREWRVEQRYGKGMRPAYCSIWSLGARDNDFHANGAARTVALAIVIAALRARQQGEDNG